MSLASSSLNPVIAQLGRRLRLAVIGGGPGSFIGPQHRQAARLDDRYEIVAGALSSDPQRSVRAGIELGLPADRCYPDALALLATESARTDGADVVAIMTPNDSHFPCAMAALAHGFDVICDKPMTNTLAEATRLREQVQASGRVFCLTHNYSGYPLVRQARAMVADGQLGDIRLVQVEYVQGGRARPGPGRTAWKSDPARGGPSLVLGDIGTHAHQLLRFVTGLEVAEVAADLGCVVPGRSAHDVAAALLRMDGGARGSFWVTQAAAGHGERPAHPRERIPRHAGVGAGAAAAAALQAAGRTRPAAHTARPGHAAAGAAWHAGRGRAPRGLSRGLCQPVRRRGRGHRRAPHWPDARPAGLALPERHRRLDGSAFRGRSDPLQPGQRRLDARVIDVGKPFPSSLGSEVAIESLTLVHEGLRGEHA